MYKLVVLIVFSEDEDVFKEMKAISEKYHELYADKIKYLYVQYKEDLDAPIQESGNMIFVKGKETGRDGYGVYSKTIKALEYIQQNYEYEYVMRTNISSFLHLENILKYIHTIPKEGYAGGYSWGTHLSGTGIFMSKDIVNILINDVRYLIPHDDFNISAIIKQNNIKTKCFQIPYSIRFIENNKFNKDLVYDPNILYFRIKNADRNIDIMYFKLFLEKIYGLQV